MLQNENCQTSKTQQENVRAKHLFNQNSGADNFLGRNRIDWNLIATRESGVLQK